MANQDVKVSALNSVSTLSTDDLSLETVVDELSATGYTSKKIKEGDKAAQYLESFTFSNLNTAAKTIVGAINEAYAGGGGGGASIILGTTAPTSAQGSDGDLYVQYTSGTPNVVDALFVKINGAWSEIATGGGGGSGTAEAFVITKTGSTYDKTFAEIKAAVDADYVIFLDFAGGIHVANRIVKGSTLYTIYFVDITNAYAGAPSVSFTERRLLLDLNNQSITYLDDSAECITARELSGTLTAGATSLVLTDASAIVGLNSSSLLDFYTDTFGVAPTSAAVVDNGGVYSVSMTFEAQPADVAVKVRVL